MARTASRKPVAALRNMPVLPEPPRGPAKRRRTSIERRAWDLPNRGDPPAGVVARKRDLERAPADRWPAGADARQAHGPDSDIGTARTEVEDAVAEQRRAREATGEGSRPTGLGLVDLLQ